MSKLDDIIEALTEDAEAVKVAPPPHVVSFKWMLAIVIYIATFLIITGVREDIYVVSNQPLFIIEIILVILTIFTTSVAASLGAYPDRARSAMATFAPMAPLALFACVAMVGFVKTLGSPEGADMGHMECVGWMCILSLLPAAGLFLLLARGFCMYPFRTYGYAALASAMTAYLVLRLEEAYVTPSHLIVMHIMPMIIIIGTATLIARLKIFSPLAGRGK